MVGLAYSAPILILTAIALRILYNFGKELFNSSKLNGNDQLAIAPCLKLLTKILNSKKIKNTYGKAAVDAISTVILALSHIVASAIISVAQAVSSFFVNWRKELTGSKDSEYYRVHCSSVDLPESSKTAKAFSGIFCALASPFTAAMKTIGGINNFDAKHFEAKEYQSISK
ncbi:MAG: hypothetical protein COB50_03165 [Thiotrichales bacterium]|nr:MAG: hypothetical protein COB50_03165 [Thiotrichales bacterium]